MRYTKITEADCIQKRSKLPSPMDSLTGMSRTITQGHDSAFFAARG